MTCCPHHVGPCGSANLDFDSPIANLSAESADPVLFIGINYGWDDHRPILGSEWSTDSCLGVCTSEISQEEADLCAARANLICLEENPGVPPEDPPIEIQLFENNPQTCTVYCPDGLPFTWTVLRGTVVETSQTLADRIAYSMACRLARANRICLSNLQSAFCLESSVSATITCGRSTSIVTPDLWTITAGSLPPGLTFNGGFRSDGISTITGTPTTAGSYSFTVQIVTFANVVMQKTYTVCIVGMSPSTLPDATNGAAYSQTLTATACAALPLSWQITEGELPAGLTLDEATGIIHGTPNDSSGNYEFTVTLQTQAT